jgi:hypothetical protein
MGWREGGRRVGGRKRSQRVSQTVMINGCEGRDARRSPKLRVRGVFFAGRTTE